MQRSLKTLTILLGVALAVAPPALAGPAEVTVGASEVDLEPADAGGGTASLSLTNLTDGPIKVEAAPATKRGNQCAVKLDNDGRLEPARTTSLKATITAGCGKIDDAFAFNVVPGGGAALPVTAKIATKKKPDWDALAWFLYCTGIALALMVVVYLVWLATNKSLIWPWEPLPYLDDSWSFKDSWVSNITVVGGLLAGIFGSSDVVKAMLGKDADDAVALATIGGTVSVALIGAAGVLVLALKSPSGGKFTAGGVALGSAVALGAAGGQLNVVYESAKDLELGGHQDHLAPYLIAGLALLVLYGFLSVLGVLIQGHKKPEDPDPGKPPVSETVYAAVLIATASHAEGPVTRQQVQDQLYALKPTEEATVTAQAVPAFAPIRAYVSGRSALP